MDFLKLLEGNSLRLSRLVLLSLSTLLRRRIL